MDSMRLSVLELAARGSLEVSANHESTFVASFLRRGAPGQKQESPHKAVDRRSARRLHDDRVDQELSSPLLVGAGIVPVAIVVDEAYHESCAVHPLTDVRQGDVSLVGSVAQALRRDCSLATRCHASASSPPPHHRRVTFRSLCEHLGNLGTHVVFRGPLLMSQWCEKLFLRCADSTVTVLGQLVQHITVVVGVGSLEEGVGMLVPFLTMLDRHYTVYRSASTSAQSGASLPPVVIQLAVLLVCETSLTASIVLDKLKSSVGVSSSMLFEVFGTSESANAPIVGGEAVQRLFSVNDNDSLLDGSNISRSQVETVAGLPKLIHRILREEINRRGRIDPATVAILRNAPTALLMCVPYFLRPSNRPLALFLYRVLLTHCDLGFGYLLSPSALDYVKNAWCGARRIHDAVTALHSCLCKFSCCNLWRFSSGGTSNEEHHSGASSSGGVDAATLAKIQAAGKLLLSLRRCATAIAIAFSVVPDEAGMVSDSDTWDALRAVDGDAASIFGFLLDATVHHNEQLLRSFFTHCDELGDVDPEDIRQIYAAAKGTFDGDGTPQYCVVTMDRLEWIATALTEGRLTTPEDEKERQRKKSRREEVRTSASVAHVFPPISCPSVSMRSAIIESLFGCITHPLDSLPLLERLDTLVDGIIAAAAKPTTEETPPNRSLMQPLNFFSGFVPYSLRVLYVCTQVGLASRTEAGRWVSFSLLSSVCCCREDAAFLSALKQLKMSRLAVVNIQRQTMKSLLV